MHVRRRQLAGRLAGVLVVTPWGHRKQEGTSGASGSQRTCRGGQGGTQVRSSVSMEVDGLRARTLVWRLLLPWPGYLHAALPCPQPPWSLSLSSGAVPTPTTLRARTTQFSIFLWSLGLLILGRLLCQSRAQRGAHSFIEGTERGCHT